MPHEPSPQAITPVPENPKTRKLTVRQKRFVRAMVLPDVNGNASEAARRAGYSEHTAGQIAHENMKKPEIAREVELLRLRYAERVEVSADWVMQAYRHEYERARAEGDHSRADALLDKIASAVGLEPKRGPGWPPNPKPGDNAQPVNARLLGLIAGTPPAR